MSAVTVTVHSGRFLVPADRIVRSQTGRSIVHRISRFRGEGGQTTAEYVLVLLVAALIVGVLAAFVQSGALRDMFATVIEGLVERAQG